MHLAQSSAVIFTGSGLFPTRTALLSWVSHKITRLTLTPECSQRSDQNGDCLHFVLRGLGPGRFRRLCRVSWTMSFLPSFPRWEEAGASLLGLSCGLYKVSEPWVKDTEDHMSHLVSHNLEGPTLTVVS